MVTDRLADTIEELKIAYAAKESSSAANSTTSLSPATTPTSASSCMCCHLKNNLKIEQGTSNTDNEYANEQATNKLSPVRESRTDKSNIRQDRPQQQPISDGQSRGNNPSPQSSIGQEWTVTLTDGMGKSRAASSVNQNTDHRRNGPTTAL